MLLIQSLNDEPLTNEVFFEELKEELFLIRSLIFTSALYKKLFMKEKIISRLFLLLSFQMLFSCAAIDSKNKNARVDQTLEQPSKNVTKPNLKERFGNGTNVFNYSYPKKQGESKRPLFSLQGGDHLDLPNAVFDFPIVYNRKVEIWINYFLTRGRGFFKRYSRRAGQYGPLIVEILKDFDLPKDLIFLAMAESGFRNNAKSRAQAVGIWQFMPKTAARFGLKIDWFIDERRDPIKATIAACRYLRYLYDRFGSWELAAAAYNAGEGKVSRAIKRYRTRNFWRLIKGRYLKRETKNYVPKIMALAIIGKNLESFGLENVEFLKPLDFEEITLPSNTDLYTLSEELGVSFSLLKDLNPELLRWQTPLEKPGYRLRIPVGKKSAWLSCCQDKDVSARHYQVYKVGKKRTTLRRVSKLYKLDPLVLKKFNGFSTSRTLKPGTNVILPFRVGQSKRDVMYADLFQKKKKRSKRHSLRRRIKRAKRLGQKIKNPSKFYRVKRGDSLWKIANLFGTSMDTLILSNLSILQRRSIREGDRLIVR